MASTRVNTKDRQASHAAALSGMPRADLANLIQQLTDQMHVAAKELQFELAGRLRDEIAELKREIRDMDASGVSTAPPRMASPNGVDHDPDIDDGRMPGASAAGGRRGSRAMTAGRRR
jgi:hypothetical protein